MNPLRVSIALLGVLAQTGCAEGGTTDPPAGAASVEISPGVVDTLFSIGDSVRLTTVVKDAGGAVLTGRDISFESSRISVATVSNDGVVISTGNGGASITARSESASGTVPVRVRQKLASVVLLPANFRVPANRSRTLTAQPVDARGTAMAGLPDPTYTSSNTEVARVDPDGNVIGVEPGTAVVMARIDSPADGERSGSVDVAVVVLRTSATVTLGANTFAPGSVDLERGGSITFDNSSGIAHDVDFGAPTLNIGVHTAGQNTRSFPGAGTFPYHCNLHSGMTGTVFVHDS